MLNIAYVLILLGTVATNTIMNRKLPPISTNYFTYGKINSKAISIARRQMPAEVAAQNKRLILS